MPLGQAERQAKLATILLDALERRLGYDRRSLSQLAQLLHRAESDLASDLLQATPNGVWTVRDLGSLENAVNRWHNDLLSALRRLAPTHAGEIWRLGSELQPSIGRAVRERWGFAAPSPELAGVAADHVDNLLVRLGDRARQEVQHQIRLGVLGAKNPSTIMKTIAQTLGTPEREYIGPLWRQAETAWRTESMRIFNMANWQRVQELGMSMPGVRKTWMHGGGGKDPRPYHQDVLNGQSIPYDQKFLVIDPKGQGWHAFGPHDPELPPGEVINCTCALQAVTWEDADAPSVAQAKGLAGDYQLDWIRDNRPDLLGTPEGLDWIRRYRPSAWSALRAGGMFAGVEVP